jgi:hypothetical protein
MKPKAQKRLIDRLPELKHELLSIASYISDHTYKDSNKKSSAMRYAHERLCLAVTVLDSVRGFADAPVEGYRLAHEVAVQERDRWRVRAQNAEAEADALSQQVERLRREQLEHVAKSGGTPKGTHKRPQRAMVSYE